LILFVGLLSHFCGRCLSRLPHNRPALVTNQEVKAGNWIWLFPVTYVCHVSEEYFGGFLKVAAASGGRTLSTKEFVLLTSIGFLFIAAGMILVHKKKSMRWILITLSTVFFVNALSHTTW